MLEPETDVATVVAFNSEGDPEAEENAVPNASALRDTKQKRLFTQVFPLFR